jgi:hypothetical protein
MRACGAESGGLSMLLRLQATRDGGLTALRPENAFTRPIFFARRAAGTPTVTLTIIRKRKSRPWIAMIAAYAVALQMLLSAAVASQMAAASPGTSPICYGTVLAGDGAGQGDVMPVHQASCVLCSVGLSAPVDMAVVSVAPVFCGKGIVVEAVSADAHLPQAPPSPRLSQGPPQNV